MTWKKEKPLETTSGGCLNCPPSYASIKMNTKIIVGFGDAQILKNGELIYNAPPNLEWEDAKTLMTFENMARKDPNHDWRYWYYAPLREALYQRQGRNEWVLIKTGLGFA